jgi:hypothetical protein
MSHLFDYYSKKFLRVSFCNYVHPPSILSFLKQNAHVANPVISGRDGEQVGERGNTKRKKRKNTKVIFDNKR